MPVPRASVLGPGVAVNIILKADQPTGKLTTGTIQDLLSRGDHPRGIKVRLQDGQIGRVQSLATGRATAISDTDPSPMRSLDTGRPTQYKLQSDYRDMAQPPSQERSLNDYIKVKPQKKKKNKKNVKDVTTSQDIPDSSLEMDLQATLEKEYPTLDSALIAAILYDSNGIDGARSTLEALTTS